MRHDEHETQSALDKQHAGKAEGRGERKTVPRGRGKEGQKGRKKSGGNWGKKSGKAQWVGQRVLGEHAG